MSPTITTPSPPITRGPTKRKNDERSPQQSPSSQSLQPSPPHLSDLYNRPRKKKSASSDTPSSSFPIPFPSQGNMDPPTRFSSVQSVEGPSSVAPPSPTLFQFNRLANRLQASQEDLRNVMERHRRDSDLYEREIEELRQRLAIAEGSRGYESRTSEKGKGREKGNHK